MTAIELTTPGGRRVQASLGTGHWALGTGRSGGRPETTRGDDPELTEEPTHRVTLRDGTVSDDVRPAG